jgi:GTP cyclohydrolase FolE2
MITQDQPDVAEILRTVAEFARGVAARSMGSERYDALCAAFLVEVVDRELAAGTAPLLRQQAELSALLGAASAPQRLYEDFCRRVRAGALDADWERAFDFALHQVIDKVRVTNPAYLEPEHR